MPNSSQTELACTGINQRVERHCQGTSARVKSDYPTTAAKVAQACQGQARCGAEGDRAAARRYRRIER